MNPLIIGVLEIEVVRKDIKNLHLGVYPPEGRVRIAVPLRVNDEAVRLFAISKLSWIRRQQAKFEQQRRQSEREYVSGESHYFKGKRYLLNVVYQKSAPKVVVRSKTYMDLFVREDSDRQRREQVLLKWYRQQLKSDVPELIAKWQSIIGVDVKDWGIKLMKTKWGTCNAEAGRIWLNLELVKKPAHCLEYIVVHEMVHLLERNHNERFMAYMDEYLPQWRSCRDELNEGILGHTKWEY